MGDVILAELGHAHTGSSLGPLPWPLLGGG
jgi:hypothetical protein